jgi:hypothetical protein
MISIAISSASTAQRDSYQGIASAMPYSEQTNAPSGAALDFVFVFAPFTPVKTAAIHLQCLP